jgi:hypothetical protein
VSVGHEAIDRSQGRGPSIKNDGHARDPSTEDEVLYRRTEILWKRGDGLPSSQRPAQRIRRMAWQIWAPWWLPSKNVWMKW